MNCNTTHYRANSSSVPGDPTADHLLAFALTAAAIIAIPGPSVLFIVGRSLSLGRRGGLLSVLGNATGALPHIALVSLGVGAIVAQSVVVFTIVKLAGAGYLVYLGVQAIRHRREGLDAATATVVPKRGRRLFLEALVVGVTNPKTTVFFVAVMPQFVDFAAGGIPLQLATLGVLFVGLSLVMDGIWALTAGTARDWFARSPRRIAGMRAGGGVMMIGLGGALALTGNRH